MNESILLCHNLLEKMKNLIKKIVGKSTGRQFKFYLDMVYGILKSKSIVLNDIAHSLNEEALLKKVNERLYKNLMRTPDINERHNMIKVGLSYMRENEKVFLVDDTDVMKPYGKAFEAMAKVRDASYPGETNKYNRGYKVTTITGLSSKKKQPIPFYDHVHSPNELDYLSVNNITNIGVRRICEHLKLHEGMFVGDRGYDDAKFMKMIDDLKQYFLVRMRNNRLLIFKKGKVKAFDKAKTVKGKVVVPITIYAKERFIKATCCKCKLNNYKNDVWVVISYMDNNPEPLILITNKPLITKDDITQMVYRYSSRWRIEEYFRFKKSELGFENFRVKTLDSINNLTFTLDMAIMLLAVIIDDNSTYLYRNLKKYEKAIKDKVSIEFYRVLSSINTILGMNKNGVKNYKPIRKAKHRQLSLFKIIDFV
ncbi:MAG TPA: transposase [Erysipelotrichaceae bacterium]|nr:transposase [Erysipelotrichaceae bacterium]